MALPIDFNRRTVRGPVNPMDKSTIVSIYPKLIDEVKPTIQPGRFIVQPGSYEKPTILVVGSSSWWREINPEEPLLEIPVSSIQVADSVVRDYCNGILACNMGESMPGLFYIPGEKNLAQILKDHKELLDQANARQRNWFKSLVEMADTLWARTNGNPLSISSDMRLAAKELNLDAGKEWTKDSQTMQLERCKACGSMHNPIYPVCPVCKAINDPEKAKQLGITFAA